MLMIISHRFQPDERQPWHERAKVAEKEEEVLACACVLFDCTCGGAVEIIVILLLLLRLLTLHQVFKKVEQQKKAIAIAAEDMKGGGGRMTPWFKDNFGEWLL
jgi:hypothetical protein